MNISSVLETLLENRDLGETGAADLMRELIDPGVPDAAKGAALVALRAKGETAAEVRAMAMALRDQATVVDLPSWDCRIDTCGTGGDGAGSVNISTATALVVAAMDIPVVKHGNRSVSSRSGSADVIEALGIDMATSPQEVEAALAGTGFAFLFAPAFHPAMKAVSPVRKALGIRTVFNLLGPLVNPGTPTHQLVGAYSPHAAALLAGALAGMGLARAFVVHGAPAWDEATPVGPFLLFEVLEGGVQQRTVDPSEYGLPRCSPDDLQGGDPSENARLLEQVLQGEPGPRRDAVVLNSALVLQLVHDLAPREAADRVTDTLESGTAATLLARLRARRAA